MIRTLRAKGAVGARDAGEQHRVSTQLELFFDLCFVVAVGQLGTQFAHAVEHRQFAHAFGSAAAVFFAIWWPWMNYSWFASGFDPDDIPFRLATFVEIAASLVIAAGVPRAFEHRDFRVIVVGYVVLRLAFASQWIRVYRDNPELRSTAVRWGGGVLVVQFFWVLLQFEHSTLPYESGFALFVLVELLLPYWAERNGHLPFHPHHISERYGLFTLIVLGETVSAATVAVQEATTGNGNLRELIIIALGGLLIVFSCWWVYFAHDMGDLLVEWKAPFLWGYGHYFVFASAASIGAGMQVSAAWTSSTLGLSASVAAAAVTVPAAVFLVSVWALQARHFKNGWAQSIMPGMAVAVVLCTLAGAYAVLLAGACCMVAVVLGVLAERARRDQGPAAA